jgi:hypothetical protein
MTIPILLLGLFLTLCLLLVVGLKVIEIAGVFALCLLIIPLIGSVYLSLAIAGITAFAIFEFWGQQHFWGGLAIGGVAGLVSETLLVRGLMREAGRMANGVRRWFGHGKATQPTSDVSRQISNHS